MSLSICIYGNRILNQYKDTKTFHDYTETAESEGTYHYLFKIHVIDFITWFALMAIVPPMLDIVTCPSVCQFEVAHLQLPSAMSSSNSDGAESTFLLAQQYVVETET